MNIAAEVIAIIRVWNFWNFQQSRRGDFCNLKNAGGVVVIPKQGVG